MKGTVWIGNWRQSLSNCKVKYSSPFVWQ